jgi:hypothetical protein
MIYVVIELREGTIRDKMEEICNSISAGDWYTSAMAALADADQYNQYEIDRITQEEYDEGDFTLMGVLKLGDEGLVTSYTS